MVFMDPVKTCRDCGVEKPVSDFYAAARRLDGLGSYCKPCHRARMKVWEDENRDKIRQGRAKKRAARGFGYDATGGRWHGPSTPQDLLIRRQRLASLYGLDEAKYSDLLKAQDGRCAVCGERPEDRRLCVDHDHSCCPGRKTCGRCIRGLLCDGCNKADGLLRSDAARARALADYLDRWAQCR